jgi:hypothetical protein
LVLLTWRSWIRIGCTESRLERLGYDAALPAMELFAELERYRATSEMILMLIERGLQVMNVEAVGDAYEIAANYLRRTGAIPDTNVANDRLVEIIVEMFHRGEYNRIRLANKAISQFEAARLA